MEDETNESDSKIGNRLGNCEVCGNEKALYVCPRCELKTCCVGCVKIHKKELECNGERDKTGFVPLSKFSNLTLLSDYRFLEDANRAIDNCRRNPLKKYTRFKRHLPPHLLKLKREASHRGTTILYLPQHFTRHRENTTFLHFDTKIIYWKLELVFPQGDNIKVSLERCDENERLSSILSKFVDFENCPELYKKSLRFYHSVGTPGLEVLLKAENVKTQPSFFVLDMSSTIRENLENRIIIEYPILYVILKNHKDEYLILDPDLEIDRNLNRNLNPNIDFQKFSYFDKVQYKDPKSDEAVRSISASVKELRKYFCGEESQDDEEDEEEEEKDEKEEKEAFYKRRKRRRYKEFNIPRYENLIKENM